MSTVSVRLNIWARREGVDRRLDEVMERAEWKLQNERFQRHRVEGFLRAGFPECTAEVDDHLRNAGHGHLSNFVRLRDHLVREVRIGQEENTDQQVRFKKNPGLFWFIVDVFSLQ